MANTPRIRLRPIEREDLPRFVAWFADGEVRHFLARYLSMSMASEEKWFEETLARPEDERPMAIDLHAGEGVWRHIGAAGYQSIDWRNRGAEVGLAIGEKSMWNQGLGTEVMEAMLRHGFETLNLHRIFLRVFAPTNALCVPTKKMNVLEAVCARPVPRGQYRRASPFRAARRMALAHQPRR
jgi:RimJ/RimL family protein N-acetyltransferase